MRTLPHVLRLVGVTLVFAAALVGGSPSASAQTTFPGNINSCSDLGAGYVDGSAFVTSSHDGTYLDYTSTIAVQAVIKGGDNYNVYPAATSGTDLHSPDNGGGNIPAISHVFFCYVPTQAPTETPIPTATSTDVPTNTPTNVPTEAATDTPTATETEPVGGVTEQPTEDPVDPTATPEDEVDVVQLPDTGTGPMSGGAGVIALLSALVLLGGGFGWRLRLTARQIGRD
jgi:hypothetical protein